MLLTRSRWLVTAVLALLLAACDGDGGGGGSAGPPADVAADTAAPDAGARDDTGAPPPAAWRVGAAELAFAPATPQMMGGYGFCGSLESCRWTEGVHDDLRVTAFALEETATGELVVFASIDALGLMMDDVLAIQDAWVAAVAAATGRAVPRDRLVVSASHAHSTPDTVGIWGAAPVSGRDPEYVAVIAERAAQAAADAVAALEDADVVVARGWHDNVPDVRSEAIPMAMDGRLTVLRATRPDGTLLATLTSWPAHPTVYSEQNNALSADWVGTFRARMGERLGAAVHVHLQGPIGGVYPVTPLEPGDCAETDPFPEGWSDPDLAPFDHAAVACVGYAAADAAVAALAGAEPLVTAPLTVETAELRVKVTNLLYKAFADGGMIPREIPPPNDPEGAVSHMTLVRLGQLRFVTAPGEAFPEYAAALRERVVTGEGVASDDVVVVGLGNDWVGYLLTPEQYEDPAYGYHRGLSPAAGCLAAQLVALDELLAD